jgi:hypothetical protein
MIIVKATRDSEAGVMPEDRLIAEMGGFEQTEAVQRFRGPGLGEKRAPTA